MKLNLEGITVAFLENLKNSKGFMRGILIFFAALLTFGGPTYFMLILNEANLPRILILAAGIISLILGLVLFSYILKDEQKPS
jgi:hypothetical protein